MQDEFYDWLDSCPVLWIRASVDNNWYTYHFYSDDETNGDVDDA